MADLVTSLAIETGLPESTVRRIILSAPTRYKTYEISKRNGGKRTISQPAREVKYLQRAFVRLYLAKCPVHEAATAYRTGQSILENASAHARSNSILKMDFADFFPSIRKSDWIKYCDRQALFEERGDSELSSLLLFQKSNNSRGRHLAIGAPSSPAVSNVLMYEFDAIMWQAAEDDHVTYTRYADDLTFSAARSWNLKTFEKKVTKAIRTIAFPKLEINSSKTVHVTKKFHRTVTGLTLSNDGRVTLGKDRKRRLHAATHAASKGELDSMQMQKLAGMLAFVNSVEPSFLRTLARRYGDNTMSNLRRVVANARPEYSNEATEGPPPE